MSPLMGHGRPAASRSECGSVGQCFGTVNNSLSKSSFVSICAALGSVPPAPQGTAGSNLPPSEPPPHSDLLQACNYTQLRGVGLFVFEARKQSNRTADLELV